MPGSDAVIVGGLFVALGAAFGGFTAWAWLQAHRSASWPAATGRVRSVEVMPGRHSSAYVVLVRYVYEVGGRTFDGDSTSVGDAFWTWRGTKEEADWRAARYPVDGAVTVYHDPARPERSALSRGGGGAPFARNAAIAAILFLAGWAAILGWIRVG